MLVNVHVIATEVDPRIPMLCGLELVEFSDLTEKNRNLVIQFAPRKLVNVHHCGNTRKYHVLVRTTRYTFYITNVRNNFYHLHHDDVIRKHFPPYWPYLHKQLSKQSRRRGFGSSSRSIWRHCNDSMSSTGSPCRRYGQSRQMACIFIMDDQASYYLDAHYKNTSGCNIIK